MGRSPRISEGGFVYAVDCRGLCGKVLFRNDEDFDLLEDHGRSDIKTLLLGVRNKDIQAKRNSTIQVIRGNNSADVRSNEK